MDLAVQTNPVMSPPPAASGTTPASGEAGFGASLAQAMDGQNAPPDSDGTTGQSTLATGRSVNSLALPKASGKSAPDDDRRNEDADISGLATENSAVVPIIPAAWLPVVPVPVEIPAPNGVSNNAPAELTPGAVESTGRVSQEAGASDSNPVTQAVMKTVETFESPSAQATDAAPSQEPARRSARVPQFSSLPNAQELKIAPSEDTEKNIAKPDDPQSAPRLSDRDIFRVGIAAETTSEKFEQRARPGEIAGLRDQKIAQVEASTPIHSPDTPKIVLEVPALEVSKTEEPREKVEIPRQAATESRPIADTLPETAAIPPAVQPIVAKEVVQAAAPTTAKGDNAAAKPFAVSIVIPAVEGTRQPGSQTKVSSQSPASAADAPAGTESKTVKTADASDSPVQLTSDAKKSASPRPKDEDASPREAPPAQIDRATETLTAPLQPTPAPPHAPAPEPQPLPKTQQMLDTTPRMPLAPAAPPLARVMTDPAGDVQMHLGIRTSAFGAVEIQTTLHQSQVGVAVHGESGLGRWFSSEVPNIEAGLRDYHLNLANIQFDGGQAGLQTATSFHHEQAQRNFVANKVAEGAGTEPDSSHDSEVAQLPVSDLAMRPLKGNLSVRI